MKKTTHLVLKLKHAIQKPLQRVILSLTTGRKFEYEKWDGRISSIMEEEEGGGFAVLTVKDYKPKKFFVALSYLKHPAFMKLLEETEEVFGFDQPGVLLVPCRASELRRIMST